MIRNLNSNEFEKLIFRIEKILLEQGAELTLNAKVSDPDSPQILRQIDILVEKEGFKTHIECRHHKRRQDSKWIEELCGRKISLNVQSIIGVSSSGFTKPAILKASRLGVTLKDLRKVTEDDMKTWGDFVAVKAWYVTFFNVKMLTYFNPHKPAISLDEKALIIYLEKDKCISRLFSDYAKKIYKSYLNGENSNLPYRMSFIDFMEVDCNDINTIEVFSDFNVNYLELNIACVDLYIDPSGNSVGKEVLSQRFHIPDWEINRSRSAVNVLANIEALPKFENSILVEVEFVNLKKINGKHQLEFFMPADYSSLGSLTCDVDVIYGKVDCPDRPAEVDSCFPIINIGKD